MFPHGVQKAVTALWTWLVKGKLATMGLGTLGPARFCALAPEGPRRWRFLTANLHMVSGFHGVLVPNAARYTAEREGGAS